MAQPKVISRALSEVIESLGISEAYLWSVLKAANIEGPGGTLRNKATENLPLSAKELNVLRQGGAKGLDASDADVERVKYLKQLVKECQVLTEEALNSEQVAHLLKASVAEVERAARRRPPILHAFESSIGEWHFPEWQFTSDGTIPFLTPLLEATKSQTPITLARFMCCQSCDLEVRDKRLSPRDWLINGHDPNSVLHLARFMISD